MSSYSKISHLTSYLQQNAYYHLLSKYLDEDIANYFDPSELYDVITSARQYNTFKIDFAMEPDFSILTCEKKNGTMLLNINDLSELIKNNSIVNININSTVFIPFIVYTNNNKDVFIIFFYPNKYELSNEYYKPYDGFTIKNIDGKIDMDTCKNILSHILQLYQICFLVSYRGKYTLNIGNYNIADFVSIIEKVSSFFDCNIIDILFKSNCINNIDISENSSSVRYNLIDGYNRIKNMLSDTYQNIRINSVSAFNFAFIFQNVLNDNYFKKNNNQFKITDIMPIPENFNDSNRQINEKIDINNNVLKSITLHHKDTNILYATNQSLIITHKLNKNNYWFPLYWSVIFYNFIVNNNTESYISSVINIYNYSKNYIADLAKVDNLRKIFNKNITEYTYIVNILYKCVNTNILKNDLFQKLNRDIKNELPVLKFQKLTIHNTVFESDLFQNLNSAFNRHKISLPYFTFTIFNDDANTPDIQIIFLYKLFCYLRHNNIEYLKKTVEPIIKHPNYNDSIYDNIYAVFNKYIEACKLDSTKYYNYIPMYYFYAKWAYNYVKHHHIDDNTNILNIDLNNDADMNQFCLFLHKYDLFLMCNNYAVRQLKKYKDNHFIELTSNIFLQFQDKTQQFREIYQINFYDPPAIYLFYPITLGCFPFNFEYHTFDIQMFKDSITYFLNNPIMMYNTPNNHVSELYHVHKVSHHNGCQMLLEYLIHDIDDTQQKKLIYFFYEQYVNQKNKYNGIVIDKDQYLNMIILLLNKDALYLNEVHPAMLYYNSLEENKHDYYNDFYNYYNKHIYSEYTDDFNNEFHEFSAPKLLKYIEQIKEILIDKNKQIPTNTQIVDSLILNSDQYIFRDDKYIKIIKKFIPDIIINKNSIALNGHACNYISFANSSNYQKYLNVPICSIECNAIHTYYSFYNDFFLKFTYDSQMKIIDINIDNEKVITDLPNLPFCYLLPKNGVYFVYLKNNMYHIRYFIQNNSSSLLITINPNNLFFPNPFTNISDYNTFMNLCIDYGITYYNYIYINKQNIEQHVLNYINDIIHPFNFKNTLNEIDYIKINTNKINKNKYIDIINKHYYESSIALLNKIKNCNITSSNKSSFNENLQQINIDSSNIIDTFKSSILSNYKFGYSRLFENYDQLYKYLLYSKINNASLSLQSIKDDANLCNQIKIFNERFTLKSKRFNYIYEAFFEFYTGIELTEEQFNRYHQIISNYENWVNMPSYKLNDKNMTNIINFTNIQTGGNFPLHHLMMGKGKSAVLTPLLTLYFTLMHNKTVYIIVPTHLVKQTELTIKSIADVFNISNKIIIKSEYEIKEMYINQIFHVMTDDKKKELIFLIDEFDYILDPLKSNYNIILDYRPKNDLTTVIKILYNFIENCEKHITHINNSTFDIGTLFTMPVGETISNFTLYRSDCINIMTQIMNHTLKKNINWGIHPTKCYAIPFINKDKIMDDCNFTSHTLTIFLTFYNYIIDKNMVDYDSLIVYIKTNNLNDPLFMNEQNKYKPTDELRNYLIHNTNNCYINLINHIVKTLELPATQLNTSFIDILNIKHVYKIGYSGTLNIDLPMQQDNVDQFTKNDIVRDNDERKNVVYAINKSNTIVFVNDVQKPKYQYNKQITELNEFFNETKLKSYDALIDEAGLFKNIKNIKIAEKLYNDTFKQSRPIIFLTESDDKMVLYNNSVTKYDPYLNLINPFIYYSQSHIIGVDISQDNYPTLKGLCIIDSHSKYTTIAQAIFRLRKLNMGHTIDFYHINWSIPSNLIKQFNDKDNEYKINKYPLLLYQTFKSIYRNILKNNPSDDFKKIHTEEIKYYYTGEYKKYEITINDEEINPAFGNYFSGILDQTFRMMQTHEILKSIMLKLQSYNINNRDIFSELIFNIVTTGLQISRQIEKQTTNEQMMMHQQQQNILPSTNYITNKKLRQTQNTIMISLMFRHEILININQDNYTEYALKIDNETENIYYLPNIFCNHSSFRYTENKSGIICIYINNSMLLIPFYCFLYFKKYPMFNLQLNWFYGNNEYDQKSIDKFKNSRFFKIMDINNTNKNDIDLLFTGLELKDIGTYIIYTQLINQCILSELQHNVVTIIYNKYKSSKNPILRFPFIKNIIKLIISNIKDKNTYMTYLVPSIQSTYNDYNIYIKLNQHASQLHGGAIYKKYKLIHRL